MPKDFSACSASFAFKGRIFSQALRAERMKLEPGDAEEALRAAAAIGDDRPQKTATGRVAPDRFTHGTPTQRAVVQPRYGNGRPTGLRHVRTVHALIVGPAPRAGAEKAASEGRQRGRNLA